MLHNIKIGNFITFLVSKCAIFRFWTIPDTTIVCMNQLLSNSFTTNVWQLPIKENFG